MSWPDSGKLAIFQIRESGWGKGRVNQPDLVAHCTFFPPRTRWPGKTLTLLLRVFHGKLFEHIRIAGKLQISVTF